MAGSPFPVLSKLIITPSAEVAVVTGSLLQPMIINGNTTSRLNNLAFRYFIFLDLGLNEK
jgi:hypothetical protein